MSRKLIQFHVIVQLYVKMYWQSFMKSHVLILSHLIIFLARTASKKIGALIRSMKFLLLGWYFIVINLPFNLAWNTVVMSGLAFLINISTCWISCRNILLLLNLWVVVEMLPLKIVIIIPLEDLDPNKLNQLLFIIIVGCLIVILIGYTIFVSILRCYKDFYINSFFPFTRILWNSLSVERFRKTCDQNCFKSSFNSIFHLYHVIFLSLFSCNSVPLVVAILVRIEPKLKETYVIITYFPMNSI